MKSLLSLTFSALFLPLLPISAGAVLMEPFNSPLGGVPDDWSVSRRGGSSAVVEVQTYNGTDRGLVIERPSAEDGGSSNSNAAVYYTGSTTGITNGKMTDFSGEVSMTLANASNISRGVILRGQTASGFNDYLGYYLYFNSSTLYLSKDPINHTTPGTILASQALAGTLAEGTSYRLTFSVNGDVVEGALYDGATVLASLSHTLAPSDLYADGYFALRSAYGSAGATWFYNLQLDAVPEPNTALLMGGGLAAAFWLLRRPGRHAAK